VTYTHILVPVDFSDASVRVLAHAKALAARFEASLELLHVVPNPFIANTASLYVGMPLPSAFFTGLEADARQRLDNLMTPAERERFKVKVTVKTGDPLVEIVDHARLAHADLIVMGTHGRTGVSHLFLGSVAERVVRTAHCPVMTVR
jgi:universal stress protein A